MGQVLRQLAGVLFKNVDFFAFLKTVEVDNIFFIAEGFWDNVGYVCIRKSEAEEI
jgi:hypothetical protein